MKQISNFSVRCGAGRKALFNFFFFVFMPTALLWVIGLFAISFFTDISPSENIFFGGFTLIGLPVIMILIPLSFVFGLFNRNLQKKWITENIESNQYLVRFYQERLDNLGSQRDEAIAREVERLLGTKESQQQENRRQKDDIIKVTKDSLSDLQKAHTGIFENPQIDEVDILAKINMESFIDDGKESIENMCLDALDGLRNAETEIETSYEKLTQTVTGVYEKSYSNERERLTKHFKDVFERQLAYQEKLKQF